MTTTVRPERTKFVADRFRRVWHIVEEIAARPGQSRFDLSNTFHLSERQIQADLNLIRYEMRLPLVRRQGYRFIGEGPDTGPCSLRLQDAQLLVMLVRAARHDRSMPLDRLDDLAAKLPDLFPPHLRPIVTRTVEAVTARQKSPAAHAFSALADALLRGSWVRLTHQRGVHGFTHDQTAHPVIRPEMLIPYLDRWYVVGEFRANGRTLMLRVDDLASVEPSSQGTDDDH